MLKSKENDWLFNVLANPQMDVNAFEEVGLNATNTSLEDEENYLTVDKITNDPQFLTNGVFDKEKFHKKYEEILLQYNVLTWDTYNDLLSTYVNYYKADIFTPKLSPEQEALRKLPETTLIYFNNPTRTSYSSLYLGSEVASPLSLAEIGQTNPILKNAKDVDFEHADFSKAEWGPSVNDISLFNNPIEYFKNFDEALVLSTWDDDGEHVDPLSGLVVKHTKGDIRYNLDGEPFYEYLDGREVYGKLVLAKYDYLTIDGTSINKYDFFDSDDKRKSLTGTAVREAVSLLPLFIPGVNSVYLGLRVVLLAGQMFATLDKMLVDVGNESTYNINKALGLMESFKYSTSEYSQSKTLTWENVLTMAGDVALQLAEQRWLFRNAARLGAKGKNITDPEVLDKIAKERSSKYLITNILEGKSLEAATQASFSRGLEDAKEIAKSALAIGEELSRLYMTGITVMDAYGEAKQAGASDGGAAALTLGYALGEYAILRTDIGKWILPEVRAEKFRMREVVRTLITGGQPMPEEAIDKHIKEGIIKKLIRTGKAIANADYAGVKSKGVAETLLILGANALGEGVEETSEELLYDAVKSIGNLVAYAVDSDADFKPFDNWVARYGMSFAGGFIGGGMAQADPSFLKARFQRGSITYDLAMQELVWMIGEGREEELLRTIDRMPVNNLFLSSMDPAKLRDTLGNKLGTDIENMDVASKKMMRQAITFFKDILHAHGADLSDESVLNKNIQLYKDLKALALGSSAAAASFLQKFNTARTKLLKAEVNLADLTTPGRSTYIDKNKSDYNKDLKRLLEAAEEEVKTAAEEVQSYLDGTQAPKLIRKIIKEMHAEYMNHFINVNKASVAYTLFKESYNKLSKEDKKTVDDKWQAYKDTSFKDDLDFYDEFSHKMAELIAPVLIDTENKYFKDTSGVKEIEDFLQDLSDTWEILVDPARLQAILEAPDELFEYGTEFLKSANQVLGLTEGVLSPLSKFILKVLRPQYEKFKKSIIDDYYAKGGTKLDENGENALITQEAINIFVDLEVWSNIAKFMQPYIDLGYVHPEVRTQLMKFVDNNTNPYSDTQKELIDKFKELPSVPIVDILEKFSIALGNLPIMSIKDLMVSVEEVLSAPILDQIVLSKDMDTAIQNALQVINMFKANLVGAATDNADINNLWGINATVNELEKLYKVPEGERSNLAEIKSDVAERIKADLQPIVNKLLFLKRAAELNTLSKADAQPKIAVRAYKIFYNKFKNSVFNKKLMGHLKDDDPWNAGGALTKLNEAMSKIKFLEEPINTLYKSDLYVEIEKERILFEDALYEYFNTILTPTATNYDSQFAELFEDLDFFDTEDVKLDTGTTLLSDAHFLHWFISVTSIRTSEFLLEYNKNTMDKIAAVPVLELPIRLGYSMLMNADYVEKCLKSFRTLAGDKVIKETRSNPRIVYDAKYPNESNIVPRFFRTTLIEGVAGSGKTRAVLRILMNMIRNNDKAKLALLSHVFIASIGEKQAKTLNNALELDNSKFFTRETLLKFITGDAYDVSKLNYNARAGVVKYGDKIVLSEDKTFILALPIPDLDPATLPSLIIIDEIGRYTTCELDMLDAFAKKYGIEVIVAGDLDQSKLTAEGHCKEVDEDVDASLFRGNFYHSPKLGYSFRSDNNLKQYNQTLVEDSLAFLYGLPYDDSGPIQATLASLKTHPEKFIHLKYHIDDSGFYGDLIHSAKSMKDLDPEFIEAILKMFATFDMGTKSKPKKIGYILSNNYTDKNASPLAKYLKTATFVRNGNTYNCADYIEEFKGMEGQGEEAQYYIVEPNKHSIGINTSEFWRQLYTGLTRASLGTLVYINDEAGDALFNDGYTKVQFIDSIKVDYVIKDPFSDKVIKQITDARKDLLNKAIPDKTNAPVYKPSSSVVPAAAARSVVLASSTNDYQTPGPPVGTNHKTNIPAKLSANDFDMIAYSHITHSTGYFLDASGLWTPPSNTAARIDGLNGLAKIFNWDILKDKDDANFRKYMGIVDRLRELGLYQKDYGGFLAEAVRLLQTPVDEIRMGFVKIGNGGAVAKDPRERLVNIHGDVNNPDSGLTDSLPNNVLSLFFFQDGKPILEVPLLELPNFSTMALSSVTQNLTVVRGIAGLAPGADREAAIKFRDLLLKAPPGTPGVEQFLNVIELYLARPGTRLFGSPGVLPAQYMSASGPFILPHVKGTQGKIKYDRKGYDNAVTNAKTTGATIKVPITEYLKDFGVMVSNPMVSMSGNIVVGDKSFNFVQPGKPFVLITDRTDITTEDKLITEFENQINDVATAILNTYQGLSSSELAEFRKKYAVDDVFDLVTHYYDEPFIEGRRIKIVYVVSPEHNIEEYLRQLVDIYEKQLIPRGDIIGNDFTAIKVFKVLLGNMKLTGQLGQRYKHFLEVEALMNEAEINNNTEEYWKAYHELGKIIQADGYALAKHLRGLIINQFTERSAEGEIQIKELVLQSLVEKWNKSVPADDATIYINPLKDLSEPKGSHLYLRHVALGALPYTVNGDIQSAVMWGDLNHILSDIRNSPLPTLRTRGSGPSGPTGPLTPPVEEVTLDFLKKGIDPNIKKLIEKELESYTGDKSKLNLLVLLNEYLRGANGLPLRIIIVKDNKIAFVSNIVQNETTKHCLENANSIEISGINVIIKDSEDTPLFRGEYRKGQSLKVLYIGPAAVTISTDTEITIPNIPIELGSDLQNILSLLGIDIFDEEADYPIDDVKETFKDVNCDEVISELEANCAEDPNAKTVILFLTEKIQPIFKEEPNDDFYSECKIIEFNPYKK